MFFFSFFFFKQMEVQCDGSKFILSSFYFCLNELPYDLLLSLAVDCETSGSISHVFLFDSLYTYMLTVNTTGLFNIKANVANVNVDQTFGK